MEEPNFILGEYATIPKNGEVNEWLLALPKNIYNFPAFTPKKLELRKSTISNADNGVFALEDIKRGEIICEYEGYFKQGKDCDEHEKIYSMDVGYGLCVVGDGIGAMINDIVDFRELTNSEAENLFEGKPPVHMEFSDSSFVALSGAHEKRYPKKHNCFFRFVGEGEFSHIYIIASDDIKCGSELFAAYGFRYWIHQYYEKNYINVELFGKLREKLQKRDLEVCRKKYGISVG